MSVQTALLSVTSPHGEPGSPLPQLSLMLLCLADEASGSWLRSPDEFCSQQGMFIQHGGDESTNKERSYNYSGITQGQSH